MSVRESLQKFFQYFAEGFARIFGPSKDEYPEVGIQPFEGEAYGKGDEDL
jgi:hypothetical protein